MADIYRFKFYYSAGGVVLSIYHFTKKSPKGNLLFAEHIDDEIFSMGANSSDILKINNFEVARKLEMSFLKRKNTSSNFLKQIRNIQLKYVKNAY